MRDVDRRLDVLFRYVVVVRPMIYGVLCATGPATVPETMVPFGVVLVDVAIARFV